MSETDNSKDGKEGSGDGQGQNSKDGDTGSGASATDWTAAGKQFEEAGLTPAQIQEKLAHARTWEQRSKDNLAELEKLRAASMSETEKAVEAAKKEGRAEARQETGQLLAKAEIKSALTGIVKDPEAIAEDLNLAKFVKDNGDVDTAAIKAMAAKYGEKKPGTGDPDLKQGNRGDNAGKTQSGNDWVRSLK